MRLNPKRLTRRQVQELIASEGRLHQEFTDILEETYMTGYKNQPQVYELSDDRFQFVFDPKQMSIGGRGDIYTREYFARSMRRRQRAREDHANGVFIPPIVGYLIQNTKNSLLTRLMN
jgi:hypothetical protein